MDWLKNIGRVMRQEFKLMVHDMGLLLFFIALPLLYPVVYTLIYNPEVVRKVHVCVVDDCRTPQSRELVRQLSAAPSFQLYGYASNMQEAKEMWAEQKVYGILHIPSDYDKKFERGEQARATMYCDMSLLLRYRALYATMTAMQLKLAEDITLQRAQRMGVESLGVAEAPVNSKSHFLGDTTQGFASFIMPGIVILILQQSLMLGAGLMGASSRTRRRANGGCDPYEVPGVSSYATVWGKTLAYAIFYIPATIYILHFIPWMFHLPHYGNPLEYLPFVFPMLLAAGFLGQCFVVVLPEREYVFPVIVFTSLIFLFLSGLTWPRFAIQPGWFVLGNLVPSTWGVEGFVRINCNSSTIADNSVAYLWLWSLTIIYSILAALLLAYGRRKNAAIITK